MDEINGSVNDGVFKFTEQGYGGITVLLNYSFLVTLSIGKNLNNLRKYYYYIKCTGYMFDCL